MNFSVWSYIEELIFVQLLALANGDRVKDKQRSKSAFVVDLDKKRVAEDLLNDLSSHHGWHLLWVTFESSASSKFKGLKVQFELTNCESFYIWY